MTLIEVLVTGALFAIVLTMIGEAMVVGHRAQSTLSHKIEVHRQASNALDLLVRDAEMARYRNFIAGVVPVPAPAPAPYIAFDSPGELRLERMQAGNTLYDPPEKIVVGYWREPADSTLRRTLYDDTGLTVLPGTPAGGKVIARDVQSFEAKMESSATPGLFVLTTRVRVSTMAEPVMTEVSIES